MGDPARYTFQRCLGRGGYGEVYLASRLSPDGMERRVAVKVLRSDLPETELALARLKDEGRMLAVLDHPAIVRVLELTRVAGQVALVTEYVEGTDMARFCAPARRLPPKVVLSLLTEVAGALDCAHTTPSPETGKPLRLVHRDVKPENVRMSRHGEAKLLDFGIARTPEMSRLARTNAGNLPFTPGYTAPEAFVALKQEPATDVFALGATAYRLLVGERFYEGVRLADQAALSSSPPKFQAYLEGRMQRLAGFDAALMALVRTCLSYDPAERPTARQLQMRLEAVVEMLVGQTARRWIRENELPEERPMDGILVGKTLVQDDGDNFSFDPPQNRPDEEPARKRSASSQAQTALLADLRSPTPTSVERAGGTRPAEVRTVVRPFPWVVTGVMFLMLTGFAVVLAVIAFVTGWWMGG